MSKEKINIKELAKSAQVVGNVFARYTYGIDRILVTLRKGIKLPLGAYIHVIDEDGLPIVYQVTSPEYYRYGYDFEKRLIAHGGISKDEAHTYDCTGVLVGRVCEDGRIEPPKYPVVPLSEVYCSPPKLVEMVTQPLDDWKIKIGINPETNMPVYMALEPLVRQSLLLTGAQGTGKTTALITLIARAAQADPPLRFLIFDWTGEFSSLSNLGENMVKTVFWEDFVERSVAEKPEVAVGLVESDPRMFSNAVKSCVLQAIYQCIEEGTAPTRENVVPFINAQGRRDESTRAEARMVVHDNLPDKYPGGIKETVVDLIKKFRIVIVDFSTSKELPDEFDFKKRIAAYIAEKIWREAILNKDFGCIVVSDEAHRICPEGEKYFDRIWLKLATEGGRNCCPFWLVARRLSLVSKSVTVESQQNFICFNVEDIDRERIQKDIGATFAGMLGALPQGEAMVKSAMAFRVPGQTIHVKFDVEIKPASAAFSARHRFQKMKEKQTPN